MIGQAGVGQMAAETRGGRESRWGRTCAENREATTTVTMLVSRETPWMRALLLARPSRSACVSEERGG